MPTTTSAPSAAARAFFGDALVSSAHVTPSSAQMPSIVEEVLLGERLGRRHQRALAAVLDRAQQRVERDDRLARADVALQQPLHRHRALEVGVDLARRLLLVRRERERQRLAVALDQLAGRAERRRERALALGGAARDADLEQQQLLEREPLPARLRLARPTPGWWSAKSASRFSGSASRSRSSAGSGSK